MHGPDWSNTRRVQRIHHCVLTTLEARLRKCKYSQNYHFDFYHKIQITMQIYMKTTHRQSQASFLDKPIGLGRKGNTQDWPLLLVDPAQPKVSH